jgi:glycerol-3-phosphate O-acyltransferase/dihydroxyacetone phosphate acyltransferase
MRVLVIRFLTFALRLFFREIEVTGAEKVPLDAPVIFVVNHPNGLVDPLFLLSFAPRPVSFLAKAPLFRMPVVGFIVRKLDSIPVYRKSDNADTTRNRETFALAAALLARGGSIGIFPEGTTHSDPKLRVLKTGAARIALGAAAVAAEGMPVHVVPAGIYYSSKETFRSAALVSFGDPLAVPSSGTVDETGEPEPLAVERLTGEIERGLAGVTLQAESREAMDLVARAERIFSSGTPLVVADELRLRRRFVDGYHVLRERDPSAIDSLRSRIERFEAELAEAGLDPDELRLPARGSTLRFLGRALVFLLITVPIAAGGLLISYPTYRLIGFLARRFSRGEDELVATFKFIGAIALYPLTWIAEALVVRHFWSSALGIGFLVVAPAASYAAVWVFERIDHIVGRARAVSQLVRSRAGYFRLVAEKEAIRQKIIAVGKELSGSKE